jgi:putative flippase GtrA
MKKLILNSQTRIQFVKFSLIGLLNTGIHYVIFLFLYRVFDMYYLHATVVGYSVGLINSFILNKKWTFKSRNVRKDMEFAKFIMVNLLALIVNVGALKYFVSLAGLRPEIGQIVAIAFSTITNFMGNKFWTFQASRISVR